MQSATVNEVPRLFVRPDDAAQALGIARATVFVLIDKGELKSFKYGRRRMIRWAEVERFAEQMAAEATTA